MQGSFENILIDNNDGTVTDEATGLMWQKSGSPSSSGNSSANKYIKQLNRKRFAGHSDWRMPTVEELASLLEKSVKSGVHIAPVFDNKQIKCWTIDKCDPGYSAMSGAWIVDFREGTILEAWYNKYSDTEGWYVKNIINHVKAVRSVK
jgi:serine/threonine-protein kinase